VILPFDVYPDLFTPWLLRKTLFPEVLFPESGLLRIGIDFPEVSPEWLSLGKGEEVYSRTFKASETSQASLSHWQEAGEYGLKAYQYCMKYIIALQLSRLRQIKECS
jgi:hypothetical protein